ncbi:response regulator receiver domain [Yersinia enterocolitica]|uniref:response regulator receiver domain n=1 Tax=Yersinia enterocolitica TaxID=630 RepID=UPI002AC6EB3F|nr:hypothetical protein [Yersinia enterocolitica]HEN3253331.1 hypothetical protein [Yersinia enterocolitica]
MNNQNYNQLVSNTFCSNAIRSVMLIDDDFLTYSDSINKLIAGERLEQKKIDGSKRAAQLENFFQEKKILCDIDDGVANFDVDRIKKSDLIIIDYQLEHNDPKKTLETLSELKESAQFNLIIVYTNEDLIKVWKEICTTFIGTTLPLEIIEKTENFEAINLWEEVIKPNIENNGNFGLSDDEIFEFVQKQTPPRRLAKELFSNEQFLIKSKEDPILRKHTHYFIEAIIQHNLNKYNILNKRKENINSSVVFGSCEENKWIKSGNVFISLFNKSSDLGDNEAENIWLNLGQSLNEWKPSYYSMIKSEIQNKIEAEALSFEVHLANDIYGQAAWLNEILKATDQNIRKEKIDFIFKNIAEELYFKLRSNESLIDFIDGVFDHFSEEFDKIKIDQTEDISRLKFCAESMGLSYHNECHYDMYHALNMNTSSRNYREKYLTTGTVLFDENSNEWYLCVSAACDMVPSQGNDSYHKRLKPHRLIQVLKLFISDAHTAITNATHSKFIFVYENTTTPNRKYFTVTNPVTNLPQIDYMIVLNHTSQTEMRIIDAMVLSSQENEVLPIPIKLKLKSQLRTGYAERYQLIASQYGGRIGVDYFGINIVE